MGGRPDRAATVAAVDEESVLFAMTWSRRDFVRTSSLALLAGAIPGPLPGLGLQATELRALRRDVGLFLGRGGTIGWLAHPTGTLLVDSQFPDTARACLDGLEPFARLPVDALVNTHHHGDHTAGNSVVRDAARRIVAHERVPALQRETAERAGTLAAQVYADITFQDRWTVDIGDETVRARYYGPAHTGGDCTVFFQNADIVHMGDLVFNRLYPFIDRPAGASIRGWIDLLETVAAEHSAETLYIFGHGRPGFGVTGDRADLLLQRDFLTAVLATAQRAVAAGRTREELAATESLPAFPDHVPPAARLTLGAALGVAYDEVTES